MHGLYVRDDLGILVPLLAEHHCAVALDSDLKYWEETLLKKAGNKMKFLTFMSESDMNISITKHF